MDESTSSAPVPAVRDRPAQCIPEESTPALWFRCGREVHYPVVELDLIPWLGTVFLSCSHALASHIVTPYPAWDTAHVELALIRRRHVDTALAVVHDNVRLSRSLRYLSRYDVVARRRLRGTTRVIHHRHIGEVGVVVIVKAGIRGVEELEHRYRSSAPFDPQALGHTRPGPRQGEA
jgi:hypothetical protein